MATRNGKISQLPPLIQEELNARLLRDELGSTILNWLNKNPHVVAALRGHFEGSVISPQNLSEWRKGGYLEWLIKCRKVMRKESPDAPPLSETQEIPGSSDDVIDAESALRRETACAELQATRQARASAALRQAGRPTSSQEFQDAIDALYEDAVHIGDSGIRAKELLLVINARYAELLQDWGKVPEVDFNQRMLTLQQLTRSIAVVRRLEQNDERLEFLREKERNKAKSASSRASRPSSTNERASKNAAKSQPALVIAEGAPQCGAGFQPASGAAFTNSAPIHQSAPSSTPSDESDTSDTSDTNLAQSAHPASEGNATPSGSALAANELPESHRIPPAARLPFPANSRDRRSRFGLL